VAWLQLAQGKCLDFLLMFRFEFKFAPVRSWYLKLCYIASLY